MTVAIFRRTLMGITMVVAAALLVLFYPAEVLAADPGSLSGNSDVLVLSEGMDSMDVVDSAEAISVDITGVPEFLWEGTIPFDGYVIRTVEKSGNLSITVSADEDVVTVTHVPEDGAISCDLMPDQTGLLQGNVSWTFPGLKRLVEARVTAQTASASDDVDVRAVLLDDGVVLEVLTGSIGHDEVEMLPWGIFGSTDISIDLGPVVVTEPFEEGVFLAVRNWGTDVVALSEDAENIFVIGEDVLEDLPLNLSDMTGIAPATFAVVSLDEVNLLENHAEIPFDDGNSIVLRWFAASEVVDQEGISLGLVPGVTSDDLSDDIPGIVDVFGKGDSMLFDVDVERGVNGDAILDLGLTAYTDTNPNSEDIFAIVIVAESHLKKEDYDGYRNGLWQEIVDDAGGAGASDQAIEAEIRNRLVIRKVWNDGTIRDIRLKDVGKAVVMEIGRDGDGVPVETACRMAIIFVNGGKPGNTGSAVIDGQEFIVIYDGRQDDGRIIDPLKLREAAPPEDDGGGGCSVGAFVPGILLLGIALMMVRYR